MEIKNLLYLLNYLTKFKVLLFYILLQINTLLRIENLNYLTIYVAHLLYIKFTIQYFKYL